MSETASYLISISSLFSPCSLYLSPSSSSPFHPSRLVFYLSRILKLCIILSRGLVLLAADLSCMCFVCMCLALSSTDLFSKSIQALCRLRPEKSRLQCKHVLCVGVGTGQAFTVPPFVISQPQNSFSPGDSDRHAFSEKFPC